MKKNLLSIGIVNLINGLAGIAFIPLALKSLEAEGYGIYSIFIILTSYIYFVEMGVAKYFTRVIAQTITIEEDYLNMRSAVGMYVRIGLILVVITPLLAIIVPTIIFPTNNGWLIALIVVLASLDYLLSIPTTIKLTYNIGKEKFLKVSKFNLFSGLSKHFVLILTVILSDSVLILIIMVLVRRLFDILYAHRILDDLPTGSWMPSYTKGKFKEIISESLALSAAQLTQMTILSLGTFLVNKHFSLEKVGIYKSAFDLATKVWFFSSSVGLVVFPRFSAMVKKKSGKDVLNKKLPVFYNISWLSYNGVFIFVFFALPLIPNILGIKDMELFYLLLLGACINAHTNLSYEFLQAYSKLKEVIISSVFSIVLMTVLFYLMNGTENLSAIGIAWVISQFTNSLIMDTMVFKSLMVKNIVKVLGINIFVTLIVMYLVQL